MRLEQLQYIIEIEKYHSMVAAANSLHIAQPSLTNAVKALENELNVQIFYRSKKGSFLTPEGTEIYQTACEILNLVDSLYHNGNDVQTCHLEPEQIFIHASGLFRDYLKTFLKKYHAELNGINPALSISSENAINNFLKNGTFDYILTLMDRNDLIHYKQQLLKKYHIFQLDISRLSVISSKISTISTKRYIPLTTLQKLPIISYSNTGFPEEHYYFRILKKYNVQLKPISFTTEYELIETDLERGNLYALCTPFIKKINFSLLHNFTTIPIKEHIFISALLLVKRTTVQENDLFLQKLLEDLKIICPNLTELE